MKYCEFCGAELQDTDRCSCAEAVQKQKKNKKMAVIAAIAGIAVLAVVCVVIIVGSIGNTVNAFDYIEVTFEGINQYGDATVTFNEEDLLTTVLGEGDINSKEYYTERLSLATAISYEVEQKGRLSNGDKVTVTITIDKEASDRIIGGQKEYVVSGLKDAETFDPFDGVTISCTGTNGNGYVRVNENKDDAFLKQLSFTVIGVTGNAENRKFSNGDVLEITVDYDESDVARYEKIPTRIMMSYIVSDLPTVMTAETVPPIVLDGIKLNFEGRYAELLDADCTYSNLTYVGAYFFNRVENSMYSVSANKLALYYTADEYEDGKFVRKVYISVSYDGDYTFNDQKYEALVNFPDGGTNVLYENVEIDLDDESVEEMVNSDSKYFFTTVYTSTQIE